MYVVAHTPSHSHLSLSTASLPPHTLMHIHTSTSPLHKHLTLTQAPHPHTSTSPSHKQTSISPSHKHLTFTQAPHHHICTLLLNTHTTHANHSHFDDELVSWPLCSGPLAHETAPCIVQRNDRCLHGSPATDTPSDLPASCLELQCDPLRCGGRVPSGSCIFGGRSPKDM